MESPSLLQQCNDPDLVTRLLKENNLNGLLQKMEENSDIRDIRMYEIREDIELIMEAEKYTGFRWLLMTSKEFTEFLEKMNWEISEEHYDEYHYELRYDPSLSQEDAYKYCRRYLWNNHVSLIPDTDSEKGPMVNVITPFIGELWAGCLLFIAAYERELKKYDNGWLLHFLLRYFFNNKIKSHVQLIIYG